MNMMNMIEKVARAMDPQAFEEDYSKHFFFKAFQDQARERILVRARAAIEAMREPTEEMVTHLQMNTEIGSYVCAHWAGAYSVMYDYQSAMIDAALKE